MSESEDTGHRRHSMVRPIRGGAHAPVDGQYPEPFPYVYYRVEENWSSGRAFKDVGVRIILSEEAR